MASCTGGQKKYPAHPIPGVAIELLVNIWLVTDTVHGPGMQDQTDLTLLFLILKQTITRLIWVTLRSNKEGQYRWNVCLEKQDETDPRFGVDVFVLFGLGERCGCEDFYRYDLYGLIRRRWRLQSA
jgi:hypothetical protein